MLYVNLFHIYHVFVSEVFSSSICKHGVYQVVAPDLSLCK